MKADKTMRKPVVTTLLIIAAVFLASLAIFSVYEFTSVTEQTTIAEAGEISNYTHFNAMPTSGNDSNNYVLTSDIEVNVSSSKIRTSSFSGTFDGGGYTITFKQGTGNYSVFGSNSSAVKNDDQYVGLIFGQLVNGGVIKNLNIVYSIDVAVMASNNRNRADARDSGDIEKLSTTLYGGIICGRVFNAGFENVNLTISSGASFAVIGKDEGSTDSDKCGPGQGAVAGGFAAIYEGNSSNQNIVKNCTLNNEGFIYARSHNRDGGSTYSYYDWGTKTVYIYLPEVETKSAAISGGVFGLITATSVNVSYFSMFGSGYVGSYCSGNNNLKGGLKANFSGGFAGKVNPGSAVNFNGLLFRSNLKAFIGCTANGIYAGTLVGYISGTTTLNYLWRNTDSSDPSYSSAKGASLLDKTTYSEVNPPSSLNSSSTVGSLSFDAVSCGYGTVSITPINRREYSGSLKYGAESVPGSRTVTNIYDGNVTVTLNLTSQNYYLSYIQYGDGDNDFLTLFDENWCGDGDSRNYYIPYDSYNNWNVYFAKQYNVTYADFINMSSEAVSGSTKQYSGASGYYAFYMTPDSVISSFTENIEWRCEHYFIDNNGNKIELTLTDENGQTYLADGNDDYNTVSDVLDTCKLNTYFAAGIYEIKLYDKTTGLEVSNGTRIALDNGKLPEKIYNFKSGGSIDCFTFKITKAPIVITPNPSVPITKVYDGTSTVPASQVQAGSQYNAIIYGTGQSPWDNPELLVDNNRSAYNQVTVGENIPVSLWCKVADTSNYMQVDESGTPVSTEDFFNISGLSGIITQRPISITFGSTELTYDGTTVKPSVNGGYAIADDSATQNRLQAEVDELLSNPDSYLVDTFQKMSDMQSFIASGYTSTFTSPVDAGTGYYVLIRLNGAAANGNFSLNSAVNGNTSFTILKRELTFEWNEASLNPTYSGSILRATAIFGNVVQGDTVSYIVYYGTGTDNISGVTDAGTYNVRAELDYSDPETMNYALGTETAAQMKVEKYVLTLGYFVGDASSPDLNTDPNGTSSFVYDGSIKDDLRNNALGLHVRISGSNLPNSSELLRLDNGSDSLSSRYLILSYSLDGVTIGPGASVKNTGTYTVTAAFGSNYVNAQIGGMNFTLDNTVHTFVIKPRPVELTAPSKLELTYNANSQNPGAPTYSAYDQIGLTATYYNADGEVVTATTDAGEYTAVWTLSPTVAVNSNYVLTGDTEYSFEIKPLNISNGNTTSGFNMQVLVPTKEYSGEAITLNVNEYRITALTGVNLILGEDFEVAYENNVARGGATMLISGIGNYTGVYTRANAFTITAKSLTATILFDDVPVPSSGITAVYDGTDIFNRFSVQVNGVLETDVENISGIASLSGNMTAAINAGSYTINASFSDSAGSGNYTMSNSVTCKLTVNRAQLSITAEYDPSTSGNYTGSMAQGFFVTYDKQDKGLMGTLNGLVGADADKISVSVNYSNSSGTMSTKPVNAGTYGVLLFPSALQSVLANYSYSEATTTLTINKRDVSVAFAGDFVDYVYTVPYSGNTVSVGWEAVASPDNPDSGLIEGDSINITVYYGNVSAPVNVGRYMLSIREGTNPNYNITTPRQHTLEITAKEISLKITYNADSVYVRNGVDHVGKIYDGIAFDNVRNLSYAYGDGTGNLEPIASDVAKMSVLFAYGTQDGTSLSSAPVNSGSYTASISLYQYDSNGNYVYPAANYRVIADSTGENTRLNFEIAPRYVNVVFNNSGSISYSASSSIRYLSLGSNNGAFGKDGEESHLGNTGAVTMGMDTEELRFVTVLIKDGVAVPADDQSCIDVGHYIFAGYLDPSWEINSNYAINPALFPDETAENAYYFEDEYGKHLLTDVSETDCTLEIVAYSSTLSLTDLITMGLFDISNLTKEYGYADGTRLHYVHTFALTNNFTEVVTEERVEMIFVRSGAGTVDGENVGTYTFTGLNIVDPDQQANYAGLNFNAGGNSFNIIKRPIVFEPDMIEKDYGEETYTSDYTIAREYSVYLEAFAAFPGEDPNRTVFIYLHRADTNPNAGTYDLSSSVECSDAVNFSVSLRQNSWIGKFRINPKQISVSLDLPDNNTLTETYDPLRNSDDEPDFYKYVSVPNESEPGVYWDYEPLDNAYVEWLGKPEDERVSFSEFIKQYIRITRTGEGNEYNVGTYSVSIVIIENGVVSNNFTSSSDEAHQYWYRIDKFDLNGVDIDLTALINTSREYDGTTNITVSQPSASSAGGEYFYYYNLIALRAIARFDSAGVGENKTVTVTFTIENPMFVNNFTLPDTVTMFGKITKRTLNVSIADFDTPINLTYGMTPEAAVTYSGFATGENENNVVGLNLKIMYSDNVSVSALRDVGTYYLKVAAEDESVEPENYSINYINNSRTVNITARLVTVGATGEVYKKPVDGTTGVPGFRLNEDDPDSIINDYFAVNNVLPGDVNTLKISYGVSLNTAMAGSAGVLMEINNLYGNNNYAFDASMSFTLRLSAENLSLGSVSLPTINTVYNADNQTVAWSGTLLQMEGYSVTAEVRYTGIRGTAYQTSTVAPINAGSYTVECYLILNRGEADEFEDIYASSTMIIDRASPTIIFSATDSVQEYGSFKPIRAWAIYDQTGFEVELDTVAYSFQGENGEMPDFVPAGTHTVTASYAGSENYYPVTSLNAQTTLRITKKVVTMTFTGYNNLVYNGKDRSEDIIVTLSGVVEGDECYPVKRFSPTEVINAGRYTLEVQLSNFNYITSGAISVGFTIAKKTLIVTAVAGETPYGTTPDFEYVYEGFAEGDTVADLDTAPSVHLGGTMVGANSVAPSGGVDQNYDFVYNESILVLVRVNDTEKKGLSNEWTVVIIVLSVTAGIALLIFLGYMVKTATYRSMYNVDAVKRKVREELSRKDKRK